MVAGESSTERGGQKRKMGEHPEEEKTGLPGRQILGLPTYDESVPPSKWFIQPQEKLHWKRWREREIEKEKRKKKLTKKEIQRLTQSMLNGHPKTGLWSMTVIIEFFNTKTDVQLKRLAKTAKYPIHRGIIEDALSKWCNILTLVEWHQHGINQAHWIVLRNGYVIDGMEPKGPIPFEESHWIKLNLVSRLYVVDRNPSLAKKKHQKTQDLTRVDS